MFTNPDAGPVDWVSGRAWRGRRECSRVLVTVPELDTTLTMEAVPGSEGSANVLGGLAD